MTIENAKIDERRLPAWHLLSNSLSNMVGDYHVTLDDLSKCKAELGKVDGAKEALNNCIAHADEFSRRAKNPLSSYYARYKTLQSLSQEIILCLPTDMLIGRWNTIQKRLDACDNKERKMIESLTAYKQCLAFFSPRGNSKTKDSRELRCALKELKAFFDEKVELQVWKSSALRFRTTAFSLLLVPAVTALADLVQREPPDGVKAPQMLGMIVAGITGGLLSSIVRPSTIPAPFSSEFILLRPIVAGLAGFVFWLLLKSGAVTITHVQIAYIFAISVGFTDDSLTKMLLTTSRHLANTTVKALGHD
jgi:hypothetical protein